MVQKLKIRIDDYKTIEQKLKTLGAIFKEEKTFIDTYFNQPSSEVLKLGCINAQFFLQNLKATNGKFEIIKNQPLQETEVEKVKKDMIGKFGVKRVLKGKRRNYTLDDFLIVLNIIEDVGEFLILTGENPTEEFITKKLGIKHPEYIRVSFDELSPKKPDK